MLLYSQDAACICHGTMLLNLNRFVPFQGSEKRTVGLSAFTDYEVHYPAWDKDDFLHRHAVQELGD